MGANRRSPKKNPTPSEKVLREAWGRPEGVKEVAEALGIPYTRLRNAWKAFFGEDAYKARGKRIQAEAASKVAKESAPTRTYREVFVSCSSCSAEVSLKANQVAQLDTASFVCDGCRFDSACPICGQAVSSRGLSVHFRYHPETHPDYKEWVEEQKWSGKTEPEDFVTCRECGLRSASLNSHLVAAHGLTAVQYRDIHGEEARICADASKLRRSVSAKKARSSSAYDGFKDVACPECGKSHEVHKLSAPTLCSECSSWAEALRWENLSEPFDYVECVECGYRAENLTSHITNAHPTYREDYPGAIVVALNSPIRDKIALRGRTLSEETRRRMSENAGRWNTGLSKVTDSRVASSARSLKATFEAGREPWSKGFTSETHPSLRSTSENLRAFYARGGRTWESGLKADLTLEDFAPYLEPDGTVDMREARKGLGYSFPTLGKYMEKLGLSFSPKYVRARAEAQVVRLSKEDFAPYVLKNGKVSLTQASKGLGRGFVVVRREVARLGMVSAWGRVKQASFLAALSIALGGVDYRDEWTHNDFRNPDTGWRFRYDGYFESVGLVAEFHGYQHYTYPNAFHKTESEFRASQQRDRLKRGYVDSTPDLTYLRVRSDEPFTNVSYLRGRLYQLGILSSEEVEVLAKADGIRPPLESEGTLDMFGC